MTTCRVMLTAIRALRSPRQSYAQFSSGTLFSAKPTDRVDGAQGNPKTGILMLSQGAPETTEDVYDFLLRGYSDGNLLPVPLPSTFAPIIAKRLAPQVKEQYQKIGGGSPLRMWIEKQGHGMVDILDEISPETAPHKFYIGFSYAHPLTGDSIDKMYSDGIERAVAFSQYPQYNCMTTGCGLIAICNHLNKMGEQRSSVKWSTIDRWPVHPGFVEAICGSVRAELDKFPADSRDDVVILFSAYSLAMKFVHKGNPYPQAVGGTVQSVMEALGHTHPFQLVWQSKNGPLPWMIPETNKVIKSLAKAGRKNILLVPITFTSDCFETLHEMDLEYVEELAQKCGVKNIRRAAAPNDNPVFIRALADLVHSHLKDGRISSRHLSLRCHKCANPNCSKMRDMFVSGNY